MHLKTDSEFLLWLYIRYASRVLAMRFLLHHDIYGAPEYEPDTLYLREIKTYYEELFFIKGKTITILSLD